MNSNNANMLNHDAYEHLDADLGAFARMLDDAGAMDRARMPLGAADRIHAASLASLHGIVETSAQVSELGAIDRAAGSPDLEDRVFDSSRVELVGASRGLKLAGEGTFPKTTVVVRSGWSTSRVRALAAALLIGAAGVTTYIGVQQGSNTVNPVPGPSPVSVESLAAQVSTQMDTLFVAMEGLSAGATETSDGEFNPEWLDDLSAPASSGGGAS